MAFKFITPRDGDMLTNAAGLVQDNSLLIEVTLSGNENASVTVNGVKAVWDGVCFKAIVQLDSYCNTLTAVCSCGAEEKIAVYWLKNAAKKFALSVDDNIWAFADLTKNQDKYTSIFDNAYLNVYKQAHDRYGTTVRLNMFYEMDNQCGLDLYGPFNLSMMTEKFKDEFKANSDWLRLAFHAHSEFPDWPYTNASYEKMKADYEKIAREIIRFAGEESFEGACTTNHFGSGTREAVQAERELGMKALMGYLELTEKGDSFVSYYLSPAEVVHANEYGFWKDHSADMIYGKIDAVLNLYTKEQIIDRLDRAKALYPKKGFIEVMIHEQYFYPTYVRYIPEYAELIFTACKWCRDNGYEPAFTSEVLCAE